MSILFVLFLLCVPFVAGVGLELDQPISVSCAENFTIAWRDARGVAAAARGETVTLELHSHVSSTASVLLDVIGVVEAAAGRFVWQLPEVVPVAWEKKDLIIKAYRTTAPAVNNEPSTGLWSVFSIVCLAPVIAIKQPARVHCGETITVEWTYLFPEKNLWSAADRLTVELFYFLPLGIDPKLATLSTSVAYPANTFQYTVPATIPGSWPTPSGQNRVYFVVSKTGDRQQTSDRACIFCPYPFLTCGALASTAPGGGPAIVPGGASPTAGATATLSTRTFAPGSGPAAISPGIIVGAAIGAILVVVCVAVLAWWVFVRRARGGDSGRISVENNMHGDSVFKTPPQSPRMGAAGGDDAFLSKMQSFPDNLTPARSMTAIPNMPPTAITRAATFVQPSYGQQQQTNFSIPANNGPQGYSTGGIATANVGIQPVYAQQPQPQYAANAGFYGPKSDY